MRFVLLALFLAGLSCSYLQRPHRCARVRFQECAGNRSLECHKDKYGCEVCRCLPRASANEVPAR